MSLKNSKFASKVISTSAWLIGTLLGSTWRITIKGNQSMSPANTQNSGRIFCFWHSRLLPISFAFRNTKQTAVVSRSRDGQLAADIARLWKHDIVAGSSHRGGSSVIRQCSRILKQKGDIGITPDGPRGPREIVKDGVAQLAAFSNAPVVILSAHPHSAWYLETWDRFMIPKPFTKITMIVSDPIDISLFTETPDNVTALCKLIQEKLDASTSMA